MKIKKEIKHASTSLLKELVNVSSYTFDSVGVNKCGAIVKDFLINNFPENKVHIKILKSSNKSNKGNSMICNMGSTRKPNLLLSGHLDTVHKNHYSNFSEKDVKFYGPGINDMKGGIVVLLFGLLEYYKKTKTVPHCTLVFTPDEEDGSKEFSRHCLNAAENIYSLRNKVPDVDNTHSGFYQDSRFWGKLALGAIEMYNTTKNPMYLKEATTYGDNAGSDYWWSWGDINSLADFRIAKYVPRFSDYILNNLQAFNANKDKSVFREGMAYSWGTTNSFLGIALQVILYKTLTGKKDFDSLATYQRDYILGRNPWGISFIYNIGSTFPKHLHSQIAYFHDGYLPGALSAGPSPESVLKNYDIKRENFQYDIFNSDDVKYYDDRWDYVTNEPTIVGNATALFVFGYLGER